MERTDIAIEAWRTVDEIRNSPAYGAYAEARDRLLGPDGPTAERTAFEAAKAAYEPVAAVGRHHPDFKSRAAELSAAKAALYATPAYRRYRETLAEINAIFEPIGAEIRAILDSCRAGTTTHCGKGAPK
ncbi:MAG: hypothetical protein WC509_04135 [Candidatus Izemoplasmatales bacterium]